MQERLRRLRREAAAGDRGFTLIEVLAVVVIIGILVGIAIPLYMNYRKGASNKSAESDVRGAVAVIEQFYTENGSQYPLDATSAEGAKLDLPAIGTGTAQTIAVSEGNVVQFDNHTTWYALCGQNKDGQAIYVYNSQTGGPVKKSQRGTLALCVENGD